MNIKEQQKQVFFIIIDYFKNAKLRLNLYAAHSEYIGVEKYTSFKLDLYLMKKA